MATSEPEFDAYAVLGVEPTAGPDEIRAAFRRMVQERHPDTAPSRRLPASVQEVVEAYRILMDPARRARHDADRSRRPSTARTVPIEHRSVRAQAVAGEASAFVPCPGCDGKGRVVRQSACSVCAGTGEITLLGPTGGGRLLCGSCRGRGHLSWLRICPGCDGSGLVTG